MKTHSELVQKDNRGAGPTIKGSHGSDCDGKGGTLQVQTTRGDTGYHIGNGNGGGQRIPGETETEQAVVGLKGGRAGGPSIMRAEDLKVWLWEASWGNNPVRRQWQLLVRIIQMKLEYGVVL